MRNLHAVTLSIAILLAITANSTAMPMRVVDQGATITTSNYREDKSAMAYSKMPRLSVPIVFHLGLPTLTIGRVNCWDKPFVNSNPKGIYEFLAFAGIDEFNVGATGNLISHISYLSPILLLVLMITLLFILYLTIRKCIMTRSSHTIKNVLRHGGKFPRP